MKANRILYVAKEVVPFTSSTAMSENCRYLPQAIQEMGHEIRTFMPKWGSINERRNQLHEVIRLSGMNLIIDDTDHPLIIKVATLQPARMQVYFIFNEDYFNKNITEELETELSPEDNDERSIFYVRGTLETMKKLRWVPDVIHCSGWLTALAPLYIKDYYGDDPSFQHAKVVYSLFDTELAQPFDERLYEKLQFDGLKDSNIKGLKGKQATMLDLMKIAIKHSDGIIQCSENIDPEILKLVEKSKLPFLPYNNGETGVEAYTEFYNSL